MDCRMIHEQLPDVALGITPAPPEVELHLGECSQCAETLQALRATMNLLDEWEAPEPSPYWDVRMQARLREEQQRASSTGWMQWFRRPALSIAAALGLILGIGMIQIERFVQQEDKVQTADRVTGTAGTAVSDLQFLDNNSDMLQNFTALDDMDGDATDAGNSN
jgi:predicted anti-sigma-YlaC factor YlaD